jgi:2-(1,2-epoxy-1,2-dihydrophenyl)acetyl-CoA isomerase
MSITMNACVSTIPPGRSRTAAAPAENEHGGLAREQPEASMAVTKAFGDVAVHVGDDLVATAEIRRPPNNFFDVALIAALADAYDWLDGRTDARAIVLCSAGRHFCAGADLTSGSAGSGAAGSGAAGSGAAGGGAAGGGAAGDGGVGGCGPAALYGQAARLFEAQTPVVAAVQGAAVGGGLGLACAADFRVASPQARFAANFARLGFHQGFGLTVTLPAIVGQQRALDLMFTGRRVDGAEATRIGLADRLADPEQLRDAAHELAAQIAASAPLAVRSIRATMRDGLAERVRAAMDHEAVEQGRLRRTADFAEGIRASAERRAPQFEGR